ncbi:phage minor head protein [Candidatus Omnitrophota bacterium]
MKYLCEVRVYDEKVSKARWETPAYRKLEKKFSEKVYAEFQREYRASMAFLNKQKAFEKLYKYAKKEHPDLYEKAKTDDIKEINKYFKGWADNVKPERMADVINHYTPLAYALGGNRALNELEISIAFHLKDPAIIKALEARGVKITGGIAKTTLDDFQRVLYKSYMEEGMSPYEVKKRIKGMFKDTYKNRAFTIARTETAIAQSEAQFKTYTRNKIEKKRWLAIIDQRTRPSHVDVDGEVQPIDQPFSNGLMHPHDGNAPADEVVGCRCDFTSWEVDVAKMPEIPWTGG